MKNGQDPNNGVVQLYDAQLQERPSAPRLRRAPRPTVFLLVFDLAFDKTRCLVRAVQDAWNTFKWWYDLEIRRKGAPPVSREFGSFFNCSDR